MQVPHMDLNSASLKPSKGLSLPSLHNWTDLLKEKASAPRGTTLQGKAVVLQQENNGVNDHLILATIFTFNLTDVPANPLRTG